jgi:lysophospholipase L1-like esterase
LSWPAKLNTTLGPIWRMPNRGIRGFTIAMLIPTATSTFAANVKPEDGIRLVICQGGTNNWAAGQTAAQIMGEMEQLVSAVEALGATAFVVTIPPAANDLNDAIRQQYNDNLRSTLAGATRLIDWAADARLADPLNETYFYSGDHVHFTAAGNAVCAELAQAQIEAQYGVVPGRGLRLRAS